MKPAFLVGIVQNSPSIPGSVPVFSAPTAVPGEPRSRLGATGRRGSWRRARYAGRVNDDVVGASPTGVPWGPAEVARWRADRVVKRSYSTDVLPHIDALRADIDVVSYGELRYDTDRYELLALTSRTWDDSRPTVLITGGVHGYETSGVLGALQFARDHLVRFSAEINVAVAPCVSPWAYERIHRWNPDAIDPNRSFSEGTSVQEAAALMQFVARFVDSVLVHIDLHETTDSDETEFRPALAARDGIDYEPGEIPDGFYVCADERNPELDFQEAMLSAVADVTHVAPPDANGEIIGSPVVRPGVIVYDYAKLGLCAGMTAARFTTTTEVYPDSPNTTPEACNDAQVAAVCAGIDFALDATGR